MADPILMRIIIDTGVLFHPETIREIARKEEDVVLPSVAYAERIRQLSAQGRSVSEFDHWLAKFHVMIEPFTIIQARRYAARLPLRDWRALTRDAFIAGHVSERDQLWTTNPRDFQRVGIPPEQLVRVPSQ